MTEFQKSLWSGGGEMTGFWAAKKSCHLKKLRKNEDGTMAKAYWQSAKSDENYHRKQGGTYEVLECISVIFELFSFWIIHFSMQQ